MGFLTADDVVTWFLLGLLLLAPVNSPAGLDRCADRLINGSVLLWMSRVPLETGDIILVDTMEQKHQVSSESLSSSGSQTLSESEEIKCILVDIKVSGGDGHTSSCVEDDGETDTQGEEDEKVNARTT